MLFRDQIRLRSAGTQIWMAFPDVSEISIRHPSQSCVDYAATWWPTRLFSRTSARISGARIGLLDRKLGWSSCRDCSTSATGPWVLRRLGSAYRSAFWRQAIDRELELPFHTVQGSQDRASTEQKSISRLLRIALVEVTPIYPS